MCTYKQRKVIKMADWKIELAGKEYQLHYLNDLADSQATELYELLKELIETDWNNYAMQDNYRLYICEVKEFWVPEDCYKKSIS